MMFDILPSSFRKHYFLGYYFPDFHFNLRSAPSGSAFHLFFRSLINNIRGYYIANNRKVESKLNMEEIRDRESNVLFLCGKQQKSEKLAGADNFTHLEENFSRLCVSSSLSRRR